MFILFVAFFLHIHLPAMAFARDGNWWRLRSHGIDNGRCVTKALATIRWDDDGVESVWKIGATTNKSVRSRVFARQTYEK